MKEYMVLVDLASRCMKLAVKATEEITGMKSTISCEEFFTEYLNQLENNDYHSLRLWLGIEVSEGRIEAIEIMKDIIRYRISGILA